MKTPMLNTRETGEIAGISRTAIYNRVKQYKVDCPKHRGTHTVITHKEAIKIFPEREKKETKKIAMHIVKGGVGKTAISVNLACCLNAFGYKVLLIDADPQANMTDNFGIDSERDKIPILIDYVTNNKIATSRSVAHISEGLDLIPSRIDNVLIDHQLMLKQVLITQFFDDLLQRIKDNYDFIIIDCPPHLGQTVSCAYMFVDYILAPLNPGKYSDKALDILKQEQKRLYKLTKKKVKYKVLLNMYTVQTVLSAETVAKLMRDEELNGNRMQNMIKKSEDIPKIAYQDESLFSFIKKSDVRCDIEALAKEIIEEL